MSIAMTLLRISVNSLHRVAEPRQGNKVSLVEGHVVLSQESTRWIPLRLPYSDPASVPKERETKQQSF